MALGLASRLRTAWAALWSGGAQGVPWHLFRDPRTGAPVVTPQSALTLSGVMRACSILSEATSTQPPAIYMRQVTGGRVQVRDAPAARALATLGHADAELFGFSVALVGNGFLRVVPDGNGAEYELRAIAPWRVQLEMERGTRRLWYRIAADPELDEQEELVAERWIVHARYRSTHSRLLGTPPIASCAPAFAAALQTREAQMALLRNVAAPRVVLTTPNKIDASVARRLQSEWDANASGEQLGKTAVLSNGLDAKPLAVSGVDLQLLETAQASIHDIARCYGLPVQFLESTAHLTYASASEGTRALYALCLRNFCARLADALGEKLLSRAERAAGACIAYDNTAMLVQPGVEMAEMLSKLANGGICSPNELRDSYLGMPDIEGGDALRAPTNTQPGADWAQGAQPSAPKTAPSDERLHRTLLEHQAHLSAWYQGLYDSAQAIARVHREHPELFAEHFDAQELRPPSLHAIVSVHEYIAQHGPELLPDALAYADNPGEALSTRSPHWTPADWHWNGRAKQ